MSGDLRALERTISDAVTSLNQAGATEDQKRTARETIERVYQEQLQAFNDPARQAIHDHPVLNLLQDRLTDADPAKRADATLLLGYLNTLDVSAGAKSPSFPGYNETTKKFDGAGGSTSVERVLQAALTQAQQAAFTTFVGQTRPTESALSGLKLPEGVAASSGITVEKVIRDLASFDGAGGVNRIEDMRQQLARDGTVNPYQYSLMMLSSQVKAAELQQMAASLQNFGGGGNAQPFNREAFIRQQFPTLFTGVAQVNQNVAVSAIGTANTLDALHLDDLKLGLNAQMSGATVAGEIQNLTNAQGFMGWALPVFLANANQLQTPQALQQLLTDPDRMVQLLNGAPGMTPDRARNMAEHARFAAVYASDLEGAQTQGLTIGQFRQHREQGPGPFLAQYVAHNKGIEIVPAQSSSATQIGNGHRVDPSGGPYHFSAPFANGIQASGETLSTGIRTQANGDGIRLGLMNFQGTLEPPAPELFFRHTVDPIGRFDIGLLGHQDGDTDGLIRTSRPWVDDHFEGHREILGVRYSGRDFSLGSGTLTPTSTIGAEHGDLLASGGLTLNQGLSDTIALRTGVSGTYAARPRVDAFGEVSAKLTDNFNLGSDTYWRTGLHATHWLENGSDPLVTGYTELELNSAGNHWYSNLRHVFGAQVNTEGNYGVYTDQTWRPNLGPLGTPDAGVRVEYERDDGAKVGAVAGWKF